MRNAGNMMNKPDVASRLLNVSLKFPFSKAVCMLVKPYADTGVSSTIAQCRIWEPYNTALLLALLQPGQTFLDIGAHLGYFTLLAGAITGPQGRVFAFEPEPENFALLQYNVWQNDFSGHTEVFNQAVGHTSGSNILYRACNNHGAHQLSHMFRDGVDKEGLAVQTVVLDEFWPVIPIVHVIKIDVQGYEMKALLGMQNLIEKNRAHLVILLEFSPSLLLPFEKENTGLEALISWLYAETTAVFFIKRKPGHDLSVSLARIDQENLQQVSTYLLAESASHDEDRCADLCCVFSETALQSLLEKARAPSV